MGFAEQKDDHIRDQLIDKCKSDVLRSYIITSTMRTLHLC